MQNDLIITTMERQYEEEARQFCAAIKKLAANEAALDNLESYLSMHFDKWLKHYADYPGGITYELETFAEIN